MKAVMFAEAMGYKKVVFYYFHCEESHYRLSSASIGNKSTIVYKFIQGQKKPPIRTDSFLVPVRRVGMQCWTRRVPYPQTLPVTRGAARGNENSSIPAGITVFPGLVYKDERAAWKQGVLEHLCITMSAGAWERYNLLRMA